MTCPHCKKEQEYYGTTPMIDRAFCENCGESF